MNIGRRTVLEACLHMIVESPLVLSVLSQKTHGTVVAVAEYVFLDSP